MTISLLKHEASCMLDAIWHLLHLWLASWPSPFYMNSTRNEPARSALHIFVRRLRPFSLASAPPLLGAGCRCVRPGGVSRCIVRGSAGQGHDGRAGLWATLLGAVCGDGRGVCSRFTAAGCDGGGHVWRPHLPPGTLSESGVPHVGGH
eukprot:355039-Chlamydomonas_euryale.AAC.8